MRAYMQGLRIAQGALEACREHARVHSPEAVIESRQRPSSMVPHL
jgi:hypothetical protein